jgi:exopolyphosphatase/pppGpp-phosphohydrolase
MEKSQTKPSIEFASTFPVLNEILSFSFGEITSLNKFTENELSKKNYEKFKKAVKKKVFPKVKTELMGLIPEWQRLVDVKDASVAMHSLTVAYLVF